MKNIFNTESETKQIINKAGYEEPVNNLSDLIMNKILANPLVVKSVYLPIISAKLWKAAAGIFLGFMALVIVLIMFIPANPKPGSETIMSKVTENLNPYIADLLAKFTIPVQTNLMYIIPSALLGAFIIILLEQAIMRKKKINYR